MLLDMVMLSGGIEKSFAELLLAKGYQIRLTPKGTLPFDTDATLSGATQLVTSIRHMPGIAAAGAVLGASLYGRRRDSLITLFGYGIQPEAQALYTVLSGGDLSPRDSIGVLLSLPAARRPSGRGWRQCHPGGPPGSAGRHRRSGQDSGGQGSGALGVRLSGPAVSWHGAAGDAVAGGQESGGSSLASAGQGQ